MALRFSRSHRCLSGFGFFQISMLSKCARAIRKIWVFQRLRHLEGAATLSDHPLSHQHFNFSNTFHRAIHTMARTHPSHHHFCSWVSLILSKPWILHQNQCDCSPIEYYAFHTPPPPPPMLAISIEVSKWWSLSNIFHGLDSNQIAPADLRQNKHTHTHTCCYQIIISVFVVEWCRKRRPWWKRAWKADKISDHIPNSTHQITWNFVEHSCINSCSVHLDRHCWRGEPIFYWKKQQERTLGKY